jgi:hypothetical protein
MFPREHRSRRWFQLSLKSLFLCAEYMNPDSGRAAGVGAERKSPPRG